MTNGYGGFLTTRDHDLAAFDRLPARLRFALRNAVGPSAAEPILDEWRATGALASIVSRIRDGDREETLKAYGPTHPEAQP